MYYLNCKVEHVIIYEVQIRISFILVFNYFYSYFYFFQSKPVTKKKVKAIEDDIYDKLLGIYKGTEKVVLVKFVEAIPFNRGHQFQWKALLLVETIFI